MNKKKTVIIIIIFFILLLSLLQYKRINSTKYLPKFNIQLENGKIISDKHLIGSKTAVFLVNKPAPSIRLIIGELKKIVSKGQIIIFQNDRFKNLEPIAANVPIVYNDWANILNMFRFKEKKSNYVLLCDKHNKIIERKLIMHNLKDQIKQHFITVNRIQPDNRVEKVNEFKLKLTGWFQNQKPGIYILIDKVGFQCTYGPHILNLEDKIKKKPIYTEILLSKSWNTVDVQNLRKQLSNNFLIKTMPEKLQSIFLLWKHGSGNPYFFILVGKLDKNIYVFPLEKREDFIILEAHSSLLDEFNL